MTPSIKVQVNNWPDFIMKIVELAKAGKELDLNWTRGMFGRYYQVAYYDQAPTITEDTSEASSEDVVSFDTDAPVVETPVVHTEESLKGLTIAELRSILDGMGKKYAPASKEAKLIELILS